MRASPRTLAEADGDSRQKVPTRRTNVGRTRLTVVFGLVSLLAGTGSAVGMAQEGAPGNGCAPPTPISVSEPPRTPLERAQATATALARRPGSAGQECPTAAEGAEEPRGAASELAPPLPAPDLPESNSEGYRFRLEATLTVGFADVPREAPVYGLERTSPSKEDVERLAERLGLDGRVEERGSGTFAVSGGGELYVTPDVVQYLAPTRTDQGGLPDDGEAIARARRWLEDRGLLPDDAGEGRVVGRRQEPARLVVLFGPAEPEPLLAAYPSVTVLIGAGGEVSEAASRWATIVDREVYQLRAVEQAWFDVEAGRAFVEADLGDAGPPAGSEILGTAEYEAIALAYTSAGPPGGRQYLQPLYVFSGTLRREGIEDSVPVKAYVPALVSGGGPVGPGGGAT